MSIQPKATRPPRAPLAGSVPGTYARLLFDYLATHGLDSLVILNEAAPPAGREPSYPAQRWRELLAQAADYLHDPALGLHLGASITPCVFIGSAKARYSGRLKALGSVLSAAKTGKAHSVTQETRPTPVCEQPRVPPHAYGSSRSRYRHRYY